MNKKGFTLFLSAILMITTMAAIASASGWQQFRTDEANAGRTADSAPITAPNNWSQHTANHSGGLAGAYGIDTVPIVVGDYVYVLASNNTGAYLFKYYKNGTTVSSGTWPAAVGSSGFQLSTPAYGNNTIFVLNSQSGYLYAINAASGAGRWNVDVCGSNGCPITYYNDSTDGEKGRLFFGDLSNSYFSYYDNGTQDWAYSGAGSNYWAGCAVIGDYIVFGNDSRYVTSLNWTNNGAYVDSLYVGSGRIRSSVAWNVSAADSNYGHVFFTNRSGNHLSKIGFNKSTGGSYEGHFNSSDWDSYDIRYSTSTPVVYKGRVYVGGGNFSTGNYALLCLNESDLTHIWDFTPNGAVQSSPAISTWYDNGTNNEVYIYFTTNHADGRLYCLKDYAGNTAAREQWHYQPPADKLNYTLQGAAISGGYVFFGNDWGYLFGLSNWTRYDFNTARARESPKKAWAFKYQVGNSPGAGDPSEEFNATEYANIRFDDTVYASNQTTTDGYYAAHRFNFSIDDNEESWITKINVTWNGKGYRDAQGGSDDGATLYIRNFTSAAYELLQNSGNTYAEVTLTGEKTSSISSYINAGNVTILVKQNSPHGLAGVSHIETDYVKLVVTP
jgi:outer membrane protein assembly factor BamB